MHLLEVIMSQMSHIKYNALQIKLNLLALTVLVCWCVLKYNGITGASKIKILTEKKVLMAAVLCTYRTFNSDLLK